MKYWNVYDPTNKQDRLWLENIDKDNLVKIGVLTHPQNLQPYMMMWMKHTDDIFLFPMITALDETKE